MWDLFVSGILTTVTNIGIGIMGFFTGNFWNQLGVAEIDLNTLTVGGYFDNWFPGVNTMKSAILLLACFFVILLFFLKMASVFLGPLANAENPFSIILRTGLAVFGVAFSYHIFAVFQSPMATIFNEFVSLSGKHGLSDEFNFAGIVIFENPLTDEFASDLGAVAIYFFLIIAIVIAFITLILEMIERYLVLCLLFYTSPLAFSTLVSKEMTSNTFVAWVKMVISEYILIMMNLFFLYTFIYSISDEKMGIGTFGEFIIYSCALIGWLRLGVRIDAHLKTLGLSTAQTGGALFTILATLPIARGLMNSAGKVASSFISRSALSSATVTGYRATEATRDKTLANGNSMRDLQREMSTVEKGQGVMTKEGVGRVEDIAGLKDTQATAGMMEDNKLHLQYGDNGSDGSMVFMDTDKYSMESSDFMHTIITGEDGVERLGVWTQPGTEGSALEHANAFGADKLRNEVESEFSGKNYTVNPIDDRPGAYLVHDSLTGKTQAVELAGLYRNNENYHSFNTTFGKGQDTVHARIVDIPKDGPYSTYKPQPAKAGGTVKEKVSSGSAAASSSGASRIFKNYGNTSPGGKSGQTKTRK